jgi:hypothetical protein
MSQQLCYAPGQDIIDGRAYDKDTFRNCRAVIEQRSVAFAVIVAKLTNLTCSLMLTSLRPQRA